MSHRSNSFEDGSPLVDVLEGPPSPEAQVRKFSAEELFSRAKVDGVPLSETRENARVQRELEDPVRLNEAEKIIQELGSKSDVGSVRREVAKAPSVEDPAYQPTMPANEAAAFFPDPVAPDPVAPEIPDSPMPAVPSRGAKPRRRRQRTNRGQASPVAPSHLPRKKIRSEDFRRIPEDPTTADSPVQREGTKTPFTPNPEDSAAVIANAKSKRPRPRSQMPGPAQPAFQPRTQWVPNAEPSYEPAQPQGAGREHSPRRKSKTRENLLVGILICSLCGLTTLMVPNIRTKVMGLVFPDNKADKVEELESIPPTSAETGDNATAQIVVSGPR